MLILDGITIFLMVIVDNLYSYFQIAAFSYLICQWPKNSKIYLVHILSDEFILNFVSLTECIDHIQKFLILHLFLIHINSLDIFAKLNRTMNLDLFVGCCY